MSEEAPVVSWSYSAMNTFDTCPRMYQAKYVTKEVPYVQNASAKWGDDVHKALEDNIKVGKPLPSNMAMYQRFLDAVKFRADKIGGELVAEQQVALTKDLHAVSWFTKKTAKTPVWFRTKIDVVLHASGYGEVYDYKTGKRKFDKDQLHLYALVAFILYPDMNRLKAGFIWLKDGVIDKPVEYTRDMLPDMLKYWHERYDILEEAWILDDFPPKPSGLCHGWCEVTSCPHWQPKRGR
jgi:hypothetical protein